MLECKEVIDGRNNKNILEDTFEAFIGALYLDTNDILFVKEFLINIYEKYIDFTDIIINDTNYKDQLLRYFQKNFKQYPIAGHVTFRKGERSELATLASKVL